SVQCKDPSGQCICKNNVIGKNCSSCIPGFWNLLSGKGCEKCNCHPVGSVSEICDELYGTCKCHPGVGGEKCDKCLPGYYG
ncbi:Laminin subunit gamma-1, partial [Stegodyphus mimosarum]